MKNPSDPPLLVWLLVLAPTGFIGMLFALLTVIDYMWMNPETREFVRNYEQRIWMTAICGYIVITLLLVFLCKRYDR